MTRGESTGSGFFQGLESMDRITELAKKLRPIYRLHPNEKYFPIDFRDYIARSAIYVDGEVVATRPTPADVHALMSPGGALAGTPAFGDWTRYDWGGGRVVLKILDEERARMRRGDKTLSAKQTCMARPGTDKNGAYLEGTVNLFYNTWWGYNGTIGMAPIGGFITGSEYSVGAHETDIETVMLNVNLETGSVNHVMLAQHNKGTWYNFKDFKKDHGRMVVFVAKHSHEHYPIDGTVYRSETYLAGNDVTGKGSMFYPDVEMVPFFWGGQNYRIPGVSDAITTLKVDTGGLYVRNQDLSPDTSWMALPVAIWKTPDEHGPWSLYETKKNSTWHASNNKPAILQTKVSRWLPWL